MKDFSRRDAIKLGAGALAAASLPNFARAKGATGTNNIGLELVPFTITNKTGQDVYMYAFGTTSPGSRPQINNYYVSDLKGNCKEFPPNAGPTPYGVKLTGTVTNAFWPMLPGSRIYFSLGEKLTVVSTDPTGVPYGISGINPTGNPNFNTLWDFIETNSQLLPDGNMVFQWDTTQVNQFALSFELLLMGGTPSNPKVPLEFTLGFPAGGVRAKIFAEIAAAGAPWSNLIIPNPAGGPALRVLQPYYSITGTGTGSGFPTDYLHDYIHNVIVPYYDETTTNRLIYAYQTPPIWKGYTSGGQFIFEPDNKDAKETYTFGIPNTGEVYGNQGYFGIPNDQYSNGIAGALEASICRSTLAFYPEFPVPQTERNLYYTKQPTFEYARILHKFALDNHCFAFQLDEIAQDAGPLNQVWNPTSLDVTIHGLT